jgi:hypothetical protein
MHAPTATRGERVEFRHLVADRYLYAGTIDRPSHRGRACRRSGRVDEARVAVQGGLALDPSFTISHFRAIAASANPTCLAQRKRLRNGMRKARMLEE